MIDHKLKVGFVGAGNHASWTLYPCFQYFDDVKLTCVCDLDVDKARKVGGSFGAERFYGDYREMLDCETLDAVFCCSKPPVHAVVIKETIDRGVPLFVEKPPASTAAEMKVLAAESDSRNAIVMVGFMHRFAPVTVWAKKVMADAQFGRTMMIYAREGIWGGSGEGMVRDSAIHHIDLLRYLCGDIKWVQATGCSDGDKRNAYAVSLMFTNGILGQMSLNTMEAFSYPNDAIEIHGDQGGYLRLDNWVKATWHRDSGNAWAIPDDHRASSLTYEHSWTAAGTNRSTKVQGYVDELAHFFECLKSGKKPTPNHWDGYRALQMVEAIIESSNTGHRVVIK